MSTQPYFRQAEMLCPPITVDECAQTASDPQALHAVSVHSLVHKLWLPVLSPIPPLSLEGERSLTCSRAEEKQEAEKREEACGAMLAELLRSICSMLKAKIPLTPEPTTTLNPYSCRYTWPCIYNDHLTNT